MGLEQYQIVVVNLDPTIGSEISKVRPCVVISPIEMNKYLRTVIVAPLTSKQKNYPTRIEVKHKGKANWVALDQIKTIDKRRIYKANGLLKEEEIAKVKAMIKEIFVD